MKRIKISLISIIAMTVCSVNAYAQIGINADFLAPRFSEKRLPQDGHIMYSHREIKFDIRTSVMPTIYGEKIVLRLLSRGGWHLSLTELGLDEKQLEDYVASISRPHGLILISGPTGLGKSTILYATLEKL